MSSQKNLRGRGPSPGVKPNPKKPRHFCTLGGFAIVVDNAWNFSDVQRTVRRRLLPSVRRRLLYRRILPILRVDRRTDGGYTVRRFHMRGTTGMPELGEHVPALAMNGV